MAPFDWFHCQRMHQSILAVVTTMQRTVISNPQWEGFFFSVRLSFRSGKYIGCPYHHSLSKVGVKRGEKKKIFEWRCLGSLGWKLQRPGPTQEKKTPSICFFITCCIINLILKNKKMHVEIEHIEIYMDNVTQNIIFFSISRINKANMILLL